MYSIRNLITFINRFFIFYEFYYRDLFYHFFAFHRFGPYYCEPVVAGLLDDNTPFLSGKTHLFYDTYQVLFRKRKAVKQLK